MKTTNAEVKVQGAVVGQLARAKGNCIAFAYATDWLRQGFSLNPLSLPLQNKVFIPKFDPFEGLFGVFADSLPDGWGRLLVDRLILKNGDNPREVDPLTRLSIVGESGMGALSYYPVENLSKKSSCEDFDELAAACSKILETDSQEDLDTLFKMGGSSGGARPKVFTEIEGEDWIVKFPSSFDAANIGKMEYDYAKCARHCGIAMAECRLLPSRNGEGYFATKRFDRVGKGNKKKRIHMVSVSGLLETSHRIPNLDYDTLFRLTHILTKSYEEKQKLFRLMCFNVFAHNRDDHSKNFTYLYDEQKATWKLSPAYDLTYSSSLNGEHATCVNGNGQKPGLKEILTLASKYELETDFANAEAKKIHEIVQEELSKYMVE